MPRGNYRQPEGRFFYPKDVSSPEWKIEIKYRNATSYEDITDRCMYVSITHPATRRIDSFNAKLDNKNGYFKDKLQGGEEVRIYLGYGSADTLDLYARIDKWGFSFSPREGNKLQLSGRAYPEFRDKKITIGFNDTRIESAISEVVGYYPDISFTAPQITTKDVNQLFSKADGFTIVRDLCKLDNLDFRIDTDGVLHLFKATDNKLENAAIVLEQNLMRVEEWGQDIRDVPNRVRVHGKTTQDITWLKTKENIQDQSDTWVRDADVFDSSITKNQHAIDRVEAELSSKEDIETSGRFVTIGQENVTAGHQIYISIPQFYEGWSKVRSYSHRLGRGWTTYFSIEKELDNLAKSLVERKEAEHGLQSAPLDEIYDESIVLDFLESTHYNFNKTNVPTDRVVLTQGETTGNAQITTSFPGRTTEKDTEIFLVKVKGINLENCSVKISNNDGLNIKTVTSDDFNEKLTFDTIDNTHTINVVLAPNDKGEEPKIDLVGVYLKYA